ncbi:ERI1 exoribonuclease 3-like isoform X2 [Pollicipes pollicipes]|uniref:ERI1 exoribonuclease 3-like isoform X2 n=1 Tax=Pollicipes pollicipes TaxID=41117 RepID=UPI001884FB81|nr:ERI1 exoribonuclease 3-like isoform X2 [Pollicipes pollicipes]
MHSALLMLIKTLHATSIGSSKYIKHCAQSSRLLSVMDKNGGPVQNYDFFLVLDFEATCESSVRISPQEVIEFPCLKVNAKTFKIESEFHHYVRPVHHPTLTSFCTELTGIIQETVDESEPFPAVLARFEAWHAAELPADSRALFLTYGDWDLKTMLPNQCRLSGVPLPPFMRSWGNVKHLCADVRGSWPRGMDRLMKELGLPLIGRHHSGIDDCRNIARIVELMCRRGAVVSETGSLGSESGARNH